MLLCHGTNVNFDYYLRSDSIPCYWIKHQTIYSFAQFRFTLLRWKDTQNYRNSTERKYIYLSVMYTLKEIHLTNKSDSNSIDSYSFHITRSFRINQATAQIFKHKIFHFLVISLNKEIVGWHSYCIDTPSMISMGTYLTKRNLQSYLIRWLFVIVMGYEAYNNSIYWNLTEKKKEFTSCHTKA